MNKPISIRDILTEGRYIIPIYQRNFAWSNREITQLICDIYQYDNDYYLGTLIVHVENHRSYVVDGQQRLTALNLIHAVLNSGNQKLSSNLEFESRPKCRTYLDGLLGNYHYTKAEGNVDVSVFAMKEGVEVVENYLINSGIERFSVEKFAKRFYDNTFLFCAELPKATDLNHYFEIMNSRGEQLEQHETVKALLMSKIGENYQREVDTVWNACSMMDSHVLQVLNDFKYIDFKFSEYGDMPSFSDDLTPFTMTEIIAGNDGQKATNQDDSNNCTIEKYRSILDFSNFLLVALSLYIGDVVLDDKKLRSQFQKAAHIDAKGFIEHLLRCRILFDKYVIKMAYDNEEKWQWEIKTYDIADSVLRSSFGDGHEKHQIRMLQSMLQVSFSNNSNKKWLLELMRVIIHFDKHSEADMTREIVNNLIEYSKMRSSQVCEYDMGTKTNHFIFNYLDYLLWQKYYDHVRGQESNEGMDNMARHIFANKNSFHEFRFTIRSSIEHLWPQSLKGEIEKNTCSVDSFGNLCLVSSERNSMYKDKRPLAKKEDFINSRSKESLKQVLMFSMIEKINDWNAEAIREHRMQMMEIINNGNHK